MLSILLLHFTFLYNIIIKINTIFDKNKVFCYFLNIKFIIIYKEKYITKGRLHMNFNTKQMSNYFSINENGELIGNIEGIKTIKDKVITIPSKIGQHKIIKIADDAFLENATAYENGDEDYKNVLREFETIIIEDGIEIIGFSAFCDCKKLRNITLPNSLHTIDGMVFAECDRLKSIILPNGIQTLETDSLAFMDGIKTIRIPPSVTSIDLSKVFFEFFGEKIIICEQTEILNLSKFIINNTDVKILIEKDGKLNELTELLIQCEHKDKSGTQCNEILNFSIKEISSNTIFMCQRHMDELLEEQNQRKKKYNISYRINKHLLAEVSLSAKSINALTNSKKLCNRNPASDCKKCENHINCFQLYYNQFRLVPTLFLYFLVYDLIDHTLINGAFPYFDVEQQCVLKNDASAITEKILESCDGKPLAFNHLYQKINNKNYEIVFYDNENLLITAKSHHGTENIFLNEIYHFAGQKRCFVLEVVSKHSNEEIKKLYDAKHFLNNDDTILLRLYEVLFDKNEHVHHKSKPNIIDAGNDNVLTQYYYSFLRKF